MRLSVWYAASSLLDKRRVLIAAFAPGPVALFTRRYSSFLLAPDTGTYTFTLTSLDGSNIFVDGVQPFNNNGERVARTRRDAHAARAVAKHKLSYQ